jgi:hypothetical protein
MENIILEALAKIAYESYSSKPDCDEEPYFGIGEAPSWRELPEHCKKLWRKVAKGVYYASQNMDTGDLI